MYNNGESYNNKTLFEFINDTNINNDFPNCRIILYTNWCGRELHYDVNSKNLYDKDNNQINISDTKKYNIRSYKLERKNELKYNGIKLIDYIELMKNNEYFYRFIHRATHYYNGEIIVLFFGKNGVVCLDEYLENEISLDDEFYMSEHPIVNVNLSID